MGCLYCGKKLPPRRWKFCSDRCARNYSELLRQRRIKGFKVPLAWCKNCGRVLKFQQKDYCCEWCRKRDARLNGHYGPLVYAIIRQAVEDRAVDFMFRTGSIYQLLPGCDPEYLQRIMKGET